MSAEPEPDRAIEAARAAYDKRFRELWDEAMDDEASDSRIQLGGCLDAALAVVAPLVRAQTLQEAANEIDQAFAKALWEEQTPDTLLAGVRLCSNAVIRLASSGPQENKEK